MEVYSTNEEEWTEDYSVIEEYLSGCSQIGGTEIFTGTAVPAKHGDFINVERVLEEVKDAAFENYWEHTEFYLEDVEQQKLDDLKAVLVQWFDKNLKQPDFWKVINIEATLKE